MPKNSNVEVIERWKAIDVRLACRDLEVSRFVEWWNEWQVKQRGAKPITARTVYRDLQDFKELGQPVEDEVTEDNRHVHFYPRRRSQTLFRHEWSKAPE